MLDALNTIIEIKFINIVVGVIAALLLLKGLIEIITFISGKCGIEFKWVERRKVDHKMLLETSKKLKEVESLQVDSRREDEEIKKEIRELLVAVNEIKNSVDVIKSKSDANEKATIEILYTMINQKCERYINDLGGIPSSDIKQFSAMFDAYTNCGGNHGLGAKVDFCLNRLPMLPSKQ